MFAIVNNNRVTSSKSSSTGPRNFEKDTTAGFWDCLVTLSKILKAEIIDAGAKFGLLNAAGLPLIAPYSTTTWNIKYKYLS